ncbi:chorismate synthase [Iodidimonas gelatinilytica]|uniref:Chorismate synthase n=1 Tax=Iodidimonas gelatinilytica TaxID=1236966 RepID=A0A5A7MPT4_9PROT|nr:chorismate synthase [Iodidimonas gelatinilytica]GEQ98040.1 chorismate synthase [Iodidimonas gelatinilytica]GEQ99836.1 chorismate synthase [Iodidimonas gelatinilytica]
MSLNSFGHVLRFTSWGESHGPSIGAVLDGVPPGIPLSEGDIQPFLDQRRPGQSRFTTQRREADQVRILSGVYEGKTTGTPISLLIENTDQRSKDYSDIAKRYRPGHADFTYDAKYGHRDPRGGGRSSARETAMRVAAGAIARKILGDGIEIYGGLVEMGGDAIDRDLCDWSRVGDNPFFSPDPEAAKRWAELLDETRKSGDSLGAVIEVGARGVPAGWGAPIYGKLDADLAAAMMSINAAKGVEIGAGFEAARLTGAQNADQIRIGKTGQPHFLSNHAGGILGGISSGQPVMCRVAIKPTSSILIPRQSISSTGENVEVVTKGRHDPCVGIRGVPVAEAMLALVLADHMMLHRAQCG